MASMRSSRPSGRSNTKPPSRVTLPRMRWRIDRILRIPFALRQKSGAPRSSRTTARTLLANRSRIRSARPAPNDAYPSWRGIDPEIRSCSNACRVPAAGGYRPVPVPVDEFAMVVAKGRTLAPSARAAYVTPSHPRALPRGPRRTGTDAVNGVRRPAIRAGAVASPREPDRRVDGRRPMRIAIASLS